MKPIEAKNQSLQTAYQNLLLNTSELRTISINTTIAIKAAEIRAQYKLKTPDALQIATGIYMASDIFLSNDKALKRVADINVLVLDDLEI